MSRIESGFIPLPKVEQEQPENNLEIRLNLPSYVDQDRIGVNLTNIVKLNDWGGIRRLRVVGKYDMDKSTEIPEIVGVNSDGSAIASKKAAKVEVPTFESFSMNSDWHSSYIANRWKSVAINLNLDEITQTVREKPEGVRSAKSWARELDGGIKHPIRAEGHKNLLHDMESLDKYGLANIAFIGGFFSAVSYVFHGEITPSTFAGAWVGNRLVSLVYAKLDSNFRFSLVPGYQVDRAAILSVVSRTKTVVKDLGEVR